MKNLNKLMVVVAIIPLLVIGSVMSSMAQVVTPKMAQCIANVGSNLTMTRAESQTAVEDCITGTKSVPITTASAGNGPTIVVSMDPIYQPQNFVIVGKPVLYFNGTDGHYHLKGTLKDIAKYTLGNAAIIVDFDDKTYGTVTKAAGGADRGSIDPGQIWNFDIDTQYTKSQGNQFQYLKALIGVI